MVLLLGGAGYVGLAYQQFFREHNIDFTAPTRAEVECSQLDEVAQMIRAVRPEKVINVTGYPGKPNVDVTEDHKLKCMQDNVMAALNIAEICASEKIPWGHISSGCIFSGRQSDGSPWTENDEPNFSFRAGECSFYSGTKALAEEVLADYPGGYIWRLRLPFSRFDHSRNYLSKIMQYERLVDVENSISNLEEFVRVTWQCFVKQVPFSIYNLTNPGSITTREVVGMIEKAGVCPKNYRFFDSEDEFLSTVRIPRAHCVMEPTKALEVGLELTEVHQSIENCLTHWQPA
jgi:dTDP-4-dehydrorhamnose reductase